MVYESLVKHIKVGKITQRKYTVEFKLIKFNFLRFYETLNQNEFV